MKTYQEFKHDIGIRESSGNYHCVNKYGFLGKYQFGKPRLADLGLCKLNIVTRNFDWVGDLSELVFLSNSRLQEATFDVHVAKLRQSIFKYFFENIGTVIQGIILTLSGSIACAHLLGRQGLQEFIEGQNGKDALGTSASDYITLFANYEIDKDLPPVLDFHKFISS